MVIVGVGWLGGCPPPPTDAMPALAFFRLKGYCNHCSHSPFEWFAPLGCPVLEGPKNPSPTSSGLLLRFQPWLLRAWPHYLMASYLANPTLAVHLAFPLKKVVPSWASKATWKPMLQKSHSLLGKENDFLWDLKLLEIHPYFPRYSNVNRNFLVQYLGN